MILIRLTRRLMKLIDEGYELLGMLNWSDHFSWLAEFNQQRIKYRCSELVPKVNRFVRKITDEHMADQSGENNGDFVDDLLSLQGSRKISRSDMIAVLWVRNDIKGTETVAVLEEWILARMVLHPDAQSKVQIENDSVVGRSRAVTESDISEMIYLSAIVKEVLRVRHETGTIWVRKAILSQKDTRLDHIHLLGCNAFA
ncbi:hypothetical protein RND71_035150 [Anisodus tanguticus]|uniref:Uncharacterized protein n=1 Tax=Anisodus tanguticus TaxID=243964 RepID=A0AAE1R586_9SOLA|nr:hypothetical protein RND71_035150 [Anisodus tanguticus]